MFSDILQTKLFIPTPRPRLVERPQLITRLNEGLNGRLTLISAPAGFGKTTLIAAWLNQIEIPAAWLTLDGEDDTPQRFISYVIAALQQVDPAIGAAAAAGLQVAGGADITIITRSLINDLAGRHPQPLLLVLDDYQTVTDDEIHQAVELFVSYAPPNFHLAMTSRSDPPLPLSRWRARGELSYFGPADLRFQLQEAGEFLNQTLSLDIDRETIIQLTTRTEGWAAGLQLAGLSAADPQNFSGR
nr:AAA family ATPase [Ardenticatenaceae bacterium]